MKEKEKDGETGRRDIKARKRRGGGSDLATENAFFLWR